MPERPMSQLMADVGGFLEEFDEIARHAHDTFRSYDPSHLVELDSRAQATCTYCHMVAEADRRWLDRRDVRDFEVRNLKVWLLNEANVVIRMKKMDEDGRSRNYPTKQANQLDWLGPFATQVRVKPNARDNTGREHFISNLINRNGQSRP